MGFLNDPFNRVNGAQFTTGLFNLIVDQQPQVFTGITKMIVGGEALSEAHAARYMARFPEATLFNGYGPTENTVDTTHADLTDWEPGSAASIGRPIGNTTVFVVDKHLAQVPVGIPGQLVTGGDGLARGYYNKAGLTADRFIPNPFASEATGGERLYQTGDLVRYHFDGKLEFLGRIDDQVKLRGFRVELGEIANALMELEAVHKAIAIIHTDAQGERRIAAYATSDEPLEVQDLLTAIKDRLPHYMLPASLTVMEEFPLRTG